MGEDEPELDHYEQDHHEDRDDEGELDEGLASRIAAPKVRHPARVHRTGSIRISLDWTSVQPFPSNPMRLCRGVRHVSL